MEDRIKVRKPRHVVTEEDLSFTTPFRFLDLPVEIRLRIYPYIASNHLSSRSVACCANVRADREPRLHPAILGVNQQLYHEFKKEWDSLSYDLAFFSPFSFQFNTWLFPHRQEGITVLHSRSSILRKARQLELLISLCHFGLCNEKALSKCLERILLEITSSGNLQRLCLRFKILPPLIDDYAQDPKGTEERLRVQLTPLRVVRGLSDVHMSEISTRRLLDPKVGVEESLDPILGIVRNIVGPLLLDMVKPHSMERA